MADEMKLQSPEISEEKREYAKVNSDRRRQTLPEQLLCLLLISPCLSARLSLHRPR